jgi:thiamine biosynthesis protein ThiS
MTSPSQAPQTIRVNGEPRALRPGSTVAELLRELGLGGRRVAVALNRAVVPRAGYESRTIAPGDRVEILEAVGGG